MAKTARGAVLHEGYLRLDLGPRGLPIRSGYHHVGTIALGLGLVQQFIGARKSVNASKKIMGTCESQGGDITLRTSYTEERTKGEVITSLDQVR